MTNVVNGESQYSWAFAQQDDDAVILLKSGLLPEGIDAHRASLCYVPEQVATVGWCWPSHAAFATHPRLEADWYWVRSCRANVVGVKQRCAGQILASSEAAQRVRGRKYQELAF